MVPLRALQRAWNILIRGRLDELEEIEEPDGKERAARGGRQSVVLGIVPSIEYYDDQKEKKHD